MSPWSFWLRSLHRIEVRKRRCLYLVDSVEPDTVASILSGVSQDSLFETPAIPKGAPLERKRQWMSKSSVGAGPPSAKRRIILPQSIPMAERPRPDFDRAWAMKGDSENDTAESFHLVGSKGKITAQSQKKAMIL